MSQNSFTSNSSRSVQEITRRDIPALKNYLLGFFFSWIVIFAVAGFVLFRLNHQGKLVPPPFHANFSLNAKIDFLRTKGKKEIADCKILAIGSSMTLNNLDSKTFVSSPQQQTELINASFWAAKIGDIDAMANIILRHSQPRVFVIVCSNIDFFDAPPILTDDATQDDIERYIFGNNAMLFHITHFDLRYYWRAYRELRPLQQSSETAYTLKYDFAGGAPIGLFDAKSDKTRWNFPLDYPPVDSPQYGKFEKLLDLLQKRGIYVICSQAPVRQDALQNGKPRFRQHWERLDEIMKKRGLPFYNFGESLVLDDSYFVDSLHLNRSGAEIYTKALLRKCGTEVAKAFK